MKMRFVPAALFALLLILANGKSVYGQYTQSGEILPRTIGLFGNFYSVFQGNSPLIHPDGDKEDIYPFYQYLEFNGASPAHGISFNTFLRGREILGGEDESFDVYNAFVEYSPSDVFELRLGRQIITESFNFFLLDGGLVRVRPFDGIELVAYGGYQDKDLYPDPEEPSESSAVFGF